MSIVYLNEYQKKALATAGEHGETELAPEDKRLLYAALACAGEAGEVVEAVKKQLFHGKPRDPAKIADELGDLLWGVAYAAAQAGYTLEQIANLNVHKLAARYPEGFVDGGGVR